MGEGGSLGELPTSKDVGFLLLRSDSIPTAETSFGEAVSAKPVWKAGYGGPDLHRRNFGLPHA
ncbi:MAG: hypothetical protein H5T34_01710 [Candidatus Methanomethyliales bacterium]|nr:hypothetical protein [Candidatus Methanomethylicales archaeon]